MFFRVLKGLSVLAFLSSKAYAQEFTCPNVQYFTTYEDQIREQQKSILKKTTAEALLQEPLGGYIVLGTSGAAIDWAKSETLTDKSMALFASIVGISWCNENESRKTSCKNATKIYAKGYARKLLLDRKLQRSKKECQFAKLSIDFEKSRRISPESALTGMPKCFNGICLDQVMSPNEFIENGFVDGNDFNKCNNNYIWEKFNNGHKLKIWATKENYNGMLANTVGRIDRSTPIGIYREGKNYRQQINGELSAYTDAVIREYGTPKYPIEKGPSYLSYTQLKYADGWDDKSTAVAKIDLKYSETYYLDEEISSEAYMYHDIERSRYCRERDPKSLFYKP